MAFDGFVVAGLCASLKNALVGGRIAKIAQPEADELILTIKKQEQYRLRLSANASLPLVLLDTENKPSPLTAPSFLMLLRKHLSGARILDVLQPDMERILMIRIEHYDELSDLKTKWLIAEIMGKHSNIIFCDDEFRILDSIKHVSALVSSVREVLPGRSYFIPKTTEKCSPIPSKDCTEFPTDRYPEVFGAPVTDADIDAAFSAMLKKPMPLFKAVYTTFTGFSPMLAAELCNEAGADSDRPGEALTESERIALKEAFRKLSGRVLSGAFTPQIYYEDGVPSEFHVFPITAMTCDSRYETRMFESPSAMLSSYYLEKDKLSRMKQRTADLRKVITSAIERTVKKLDLQTKQLSDTADREKYRIYGEMLTTYGYSCEPGSPTFTCLNYYTDETITIPLDGTLSALENAKRFFDKYSKQKRTAAQLEIHIKETESELAHLRSILGSLEISEKEEDLSAIRKELTDFGYLRLHKTDANGKKKAKEPKSKPYHYVTADGYHLYVGKNNYQNDDLTFRFADGGDWWFHLKQAPGSHVILKSQGVEPPETVFEAAAALAGYYSSERTSPKVEIDYVERKQVKKPNGAKPGFVVYYTNYSMVITPSLDGLTLVE